MKYLLKLTLVLFLAVSFVGCSDFLDPKTPQSKPVESIETVADLQGAINGAYDRLSQGSLYGRDWVVIGDVRTANAWSNGASGRFITESLFRVTPAGSGGIWDAAYEVIANTNLIINSDVEGGDQIKGEAYAARALAHMILLKQYGQLFVDGSDLGIPYITTFSEQDKFFPTRPAAQETLDKIAADYDKALTLLDPTVNTPATQITYYAVKALQARLYLFTGDYASAAAAAKDVIDSGTYALETAGNYVTAWADDGGPAAIFEVDMNTTDNRGSGSIFQILQGESYGDIEVSEGLYNLFGTNDVRLGLYGSEVTAADTTTPFINYRVTGKYISRDTNTPVIRYAEVILTYAEAKARPGAQQDLAEAKTYLDLLTTHRNIPAYTTASVENILLERRKELAMEGDYYWQLMRNGKGIARDNLRPGKEGSEITVPFGDPRLAYPIPLAETNANPNMQQNEGYGGGS